MTSRGLIIYACASEGTAVTLGVINAAYTTFGDTMPQTPWGFVPALPLIGRCRGGRTSAHSGQSLQQA